MLHATNQLMVDSNVKSKTIFHFCAAGIITNPIANAITYAYTIPLVKNTFRNVVGLPVELHMSMESSGSRKVRTPRLLSETGNTLRVKRKRKKTIEHKAMEGIQDTIGEQTMSIKRHTHHMSKKRKKHKRKRHSSKVANGQLPDKGEGSQNVNSTRESRKVSSTEARNGNSLDESLHLQQQNLSNEKAAETVGETGFQYDTVLSSHDTRE
ncbi:uncharacterized protein [Littorina saxatilis]|uniref:uncharacterized protein n=1 Tax=Littorina saxatilis TaxID=31220 RepID=UPI0038B45BBA